MKKLYALLGAFLVLFDLQVFAQPVPYVGQPRLYYGVAYYPEVWDKENVAEDIRYMSDLHMNVVRMAEFSWALMEPAEGVYDFTWLHDIIDQLHASDIDVILGTPTATPPAWLAEKHPEIFRMNPYGHRTGHGARRSASFTSEVYLEYCRKIVEAMASEFGNKNGVIAWQIDNELHASPDYSLETKRKWEVWLVEKYGTIDNLNEIWKTQLWSQKYDNFAQIPMPADDRWHHPTLRLDWKHFTTDQVVHFQQMQVDIIRKYSDRPITHDGMPGQSMDYVQLFEDLDFMAVNNYHSFPVYNRVQGNYDRMRGYQRGMHWLFETAPNYSGGGNNGNTWFIHQPRGAMRAALWMNFALGGQGSLFWLWRQHPAGHEMPHGAILSAWGEPMANYDELKQLGRELNESSHLLMNTPVDPAPIAIYYDHNSEAGLRIESSVNGISYYKDWTHRFYRPLADLYLHQDVINYHSDINDYKVIMAPLMPDLSRVENKLQNWVEAGGTLVLGPMSGYRNAHWTANTDYALGDWETWMGMGVKTRIPIDLNNSKYAEPVWVEMEGVPNPKPVKAELWSEALYTGKEGMILARYQRGMHDGQPAITSHKVGKGKVILLGCDPGYQYIQAILLNLAKEKGISPLAKGDKDLVVVPRSGAEANLRILINLTNDEKEIEIYDFRGADLITKEPLSGKLTLDPFQVIIAEDRDTP